MIETKSPPRKKQTPSFSEAHRQEILRDFRICCISREASIMARKEVLSGRANFGIIGDGKEVAQVAMAKAWKPGDFRSGYYRDQTLMLALGVTTLDDFFAQLYSDPERDIFSGGRQMNCHFATPFVDKDGKWVRQVDRYNITSDIAPTAGQMARAIGLALASKKYREVPAIADGFSNNGNEVTFCTIGDASTSEGPFWETMNAAAVMQVPLAVSVWDDGFGISVHQKYQTVKENISEALKGFGGDEPTSIDIYTCKGWDYPALCAMYTTAIDKMRTTHRPALIHIQELTQQLGHSTSGDHRRYKSPERLAFEEAFDCNRLMAEWMVENGITTEAAIEAIKAEAKKEVADAARRAYRGYHDAVDLLKNELTGLLEAVRESHPDNPAIDAIVNQITDLRQPLRHELTALARRAVWNLAGQTSASVSALVALAETESREGTRVFSDFLLSHSEQSALRIPVVPAQYSDESSVKDGFEVLNACFDHNLEHYPNLFAFGEDVGMIGDVNQGMRGMQQKYGIERVFDTGIREWTIMGQAIGMAMRGLRPIAEIQYLDYLLYGLAPLSDDLATLRWRSNNQQAAPAIIRTRGHRLVGVWHSGSPMGLMLGSLRGMWICVPRNMVQAAGMYNTLLKSDDPAIVVEVLNGYRLKERMPDNIGTFTVPLGTPEIIRTGTDITVVTYGASLRIAEDAAEHLERHGISMELIDVQTLLPFDLTNTCVESLKKTNRVLFLDEDVPGGASAFLMQQVLEVQGGYKYLDSPPVTLAAQEHRPAYGQDGDYYSKPQVEDVFETIYRLIRESDPQRLPPLN
jgi:pyruvate/2-oxoglutarate/acetoin dehydrogenase E1 component/TPP-dependent pyruvate/acetoin dehydrogenase alpha subunit